VRLLARELNAPVEPVDGRRVDDDVVDVLDGKKTPALFLGFRNPSRIVIFVPDWIPCKVVVPNWPLDVFEDPVFELPELGLKELVICA
jgi:hypothetical protein